MAIKKILFLCKDFKTLSLFTLKLLKQVITKQLNFRINTKYIYLLFQPTKTQLKVLGKLNSFSFIDSENKIRSCKKLKTT